MDDLELYGNSEKETKRLVSTVKVFSQDICMEFSIKRCGVISINRWKFKSTGRIESPSGQKIREIEEDGYKYLGMLDYDRMKEQEIKDTFRNLFFRSTELILKSKHLVSLHYEVMVVEYLSEIRMNYKNLTERPVNLWQWIGNWCDVAWLYVFRKNCGRGFIGCENSVKREENGLGWYVKNNIEPSLVAVWISRTMIHEETADPKEFQKTKEDQRKNLWTAKRMHGQFARDMENKDKNNRWRWMIKIDLKGCTKALICSDWEQSIRTNYIKYNIDKSSESPLFRMCGTRNQTMSHIVSECGRFAQKE